MRRIEIAPAVLEAIVTHARADLPNECCGLLIGTSGRIEESVPARNVLASPIAYRLDPVQHFDALRRARAGGRAVIGAYHSHVRTAAEASERDIAEAHDPDLLYVIVSLRDTLRPEVRAYRIAGGKAAEVSLDARAW